MRLISASEVGDVLSVLMDNSRYNLRGGGSDHDPTVALKRSGIPFDFKSPNKCLEVVPACYLET